jgi:hypothetical protein
MDQDNGVKKIECKACGREVLLYDSWANTCDCGAEYNGFGQRLAPRSQWGDETGEVFDDFDDLEV